MIRYKNGKRRDGVMLQLSFLLNLIININSKRKKKCSILADI